MREPHRQRQILASPGENGQQTPIVVVIAKNDSARYLVIDGYKRIAALEPLRGDTVEATGLADGRSRSSAAVAVVATGARRKALEQGWLLSEMEQRFGYSARRTGGAPLRPQRELGIEATGAGRVVAGTGPAASARWESAAQIAMKYLGPIARVSADGCERMAAILVKHCCDTRQAAQLYTAWREGSRVVRERILTEPALFLKAKNAAAIDNSDAESGRTGRVGSADGAGHCAPRRPQTQRSIAGDECGTAGSRRNARLESARRELNRMAEGIGKEQETKQAEPGGSERRILELSAKGVSRHEIARVLRVSRPTVRKVLRSNSAGVPEIQRKEESRTLPAIDPGSFGFLQGEFVRVHEELMAGGAALSYQALTGFCRRQGIGQTLRLCPGANITSSPAWRCSTTPRRTRWWKWAAEGIWAQGDARRCRVIRACCFFRINPTFQRFDRKVFLTDAVRYTNGSPERVMIDNTHVVVLRGTVREMIPVPEMEAFAERLGFRFVAHAIGDANRSALARVERPFSFIENNFLAGRTFQSWEDLNQQARQCATKSTQLTRSICAPYRESCSPSSHCTSSLCRHGFRKCTGCISAWWTRKVMSR